MTFLAWLAVPAVVAAQEVSTADQARSTEADQASTAASKPSLALTVAPVVGDGPGDGHLVGDPDAGLPTLTFSPTSPAEQAAVHLFTVTNTGDVALHDVAVTDERIGAVLDASSGTTLEPGASTQVRAAATYTFEEAVAGLAGLVATPSQATATGEDGTTVTATAESAIQVVAVLSAPSARLDLEVLVDSGGVVEGVDGVPTVTWSAREAAVGDERTIHYRLTITNTGAVELVDVAAVVDVLGSELIATIEDGTLAPGETAVLEVSRTFTLDETGGDPATGVEVAAVAELQAVDGTGQAVAARGQAEVLVVVVAPDEPDGLVASDELVEEEVLPAAGPRQGSVELLVVAVLLLLLGADLLWITRRRTAAAGRPRPRR